MDAIRAPPRARRLDAVYGSLETMGVAGLKANRARGFKGKAMVSA